MTQTTFQIDDADFQLVRKVVHNHCGISLSNEKRALVQARITRQMRAGGFDSAREYLQLALSEPTGRMFREFIDAISTNLTGFFREPDHFKHIVNHVVPALVQRARHPEDRRLLAWSAGCSTGEESYSLAITLAEGLATANANGPADWDVRILATDISTRVLSAATNGQYPAQRLAELPATLRAKYFRAAGDAGDYLICPLLRQWVRVRRLNLIDFWPFRGPFDLIMCRNVMIYFDRPTQQKLVHRFWNCLKPGGLLFTGHSESMTAISHRFRSLEPTIYERI